MARWQYTKGLHDLGNGCYAYLQPDGSWGWSNAGLVVDGDATLLVDTLFDLALTREMLDRMRAAVPASAHIGTLVNTHANGDHTFGNQLVEGAEIIASQACAEEMIERPPAQLAMIMKNWAAMGEAGAFLHETMGSRFTFDGIALAPPHRTFDERMTLSVGAKRVELLMVGPAHTKGDVLVHVPDDRTVFTGDILFIGGHPVLWAGPIDNWLKACDLILSWDVETIVPGHGPVTDKAGVRHFRGYLDYIKREARRRFDAGMTVEQAARDIALDAYADWLDAERIAINVATLYREFSGDRSSPDIRSMFGLMARYYYERKADAPGVPTDHRHSQPGG